MKSTVYFIAILTVVISPAYLQADPIVVKPQSIHLNQCTDQQFKIKFLCDPNWEIQTDEGVMMMIVSKEPYVTVTIAQSDQVIGSLDQLTNDVLKTIGQYKDGFQTQMIQIAKQNAIEVIGSSEKQPDMSLTDVYIIRNGVLYTVFFAVKPKQNISDYENLIHRIKDSIEFI